MRTLKTMTVGYKDNPTHSVCRGHVDAKTFNKAFAAEGWKDGGAIPQDELRYEYWVIGKTRWSKANPSRKNAVAVTVSDW